MCDGGGDGVWLVAVICTKSVLPLLQFREYSGNSRTRYIPELGRKFMSNHSFEYNEINNTRGGRERGSVDVKGEEGVKMIEDGGHGTRVALVDYVHIHIVLER